MDQNYFDHFSSIGLIFQTFVYNQSGCVRVCVRARVSACKTVCITNEGDNVDNKCTKYYQTHLFSRSTQSPPRDIDEFNDV